MTSCCALGSQSQLITGAVCGGGEREGGGRGREGGGGRGREGGGGREGREGEGGV